MSFNPNEQERAIFRNRRNFQTDYDLDMATSKDNGIAEGIQIVARNLLMRNTPLDQIVKATELTLEEVEDLRA